MVSLKQCTECSAGVNAFKTPQNELSFALFLGEIFCVLQQIVLCNSGKGKSCGCILKKNNRTGSVHVRLCLAASILAAGKASVLSIKWDELLIDVY
jgi:hypothetical protein